MLNPLYHWFYYRFVNKFHIVQTCLPPGYYDIDERMLYANFTLLREYVEVELAELGSLNRKMDDQDPSDDPYTNAKWFMEMVAESTEQIDHPQVEFHREVKELYEWWILKRPKRPCPYETKMENPYKVEETYEQEDTDMLIRLMKIRRGLWT